MSVVIGTTLIGEAVGAGVTVGAKLGESEGAPVGAVLGVTVGAKDVLGKSEGALVGTVLGESVLPSGRNTRILVVMRAGVPRILVGEAVRARVGEPVGTAEGS